MTASANAEELPAIDSELAAASEQRAGQKVEGPAHARCAADLVRCDCGRLLARVVHSVVELKCPRCKKTTLLVGGRRYEPAGEPACECLALAGAEEAPVRRHR
jgi:hypothetical protein